MVSVLDFRSSGFMFGFKPWLGDIVCVLGQDGQFSGPLSTKVYIKWVLVKFNAGGNPVLD